MGRTPGTDNYYIFNLIAPETLIELYESGLSAVQIKERLNFPGDNKTILRALQFLGVETRKRGQPQIKYICPGCGVEFWADSFNRKLCLTCAPTHAWSTRFYTHGITKPQFEAKLEAQSGLCALCEESLPGNIQFIRIDHCHKQGHVRDLLCNKCNIGLHYIEDDKFFAAAVKYVERHKR